MQNVELKSKKAVCIVRYVAMKYRSFRIIMYWKKNYWRISWIRKAEKAKPEDASAERERVKRQPKPVRAEHVAHWEHNEHNGKQQKKKSRLALIVGISSTEQQLH